MNVPNQVFGGCFVYLSLYAVNQAQVMEGGRKLLIVWNILNKNCGLTQVQRLLTLPSLKRAQAALWLQVFFLHRFFVC